MWINLQKEILETFVESSYPYNAVGINLFLSAMARKREAWKKRKAKSYRNRYKDPEFRKKERERLKNYTTKGRKLPFVITRVCNACGAQIQFRNGTNRYTHVGVSAQFHRCPKGFWYFANNNKGNYKPNGS